MLATIIDICIAIFGIGMFFIAIGSILVVTINISIDIFRDMHRDHVYGKRRL